MTISSNFNRTANSGLASNSSALLRRSLLLLVAIATSSTICAADGHDVQWLPGVTVRFASKEEAARHLATADAYTSAMSTLDPAARMQSVSEQTVDDYLKFASAAATDWPERERKLVTLSLDALTTEFLRLKVRFPSKVLLVRTTGKEEGGAAYCRNQAVILSAKMTGGLGFGLKRLLAHELFHITSVHNPELREKLYGAVGYKSCPPVKLPAALEEHRLTNPDTPEMNYVATYSYQGKSLPMIPILYSPRTRSQMSPGVSIFRYLKVKQVVLAKNGAGYVPLIKDGEPVLLDLEDVPEYSERIGKNTSYLYHPEEALAENFSLMVNGETDVKDPQLLESIRKCFIESAEGK